MSPNMTVQTVTNQYLAPHWWDLVLRDNYFFSKVMQNTKRGDWNGSQMLFPINFVALFRRLIAA